MFKNLSRDDLMGLSFELKGRMSAQNLAFILPMLSIGIFMVGSISMFIAPSNALVDAQLWLPISYFFKGIIALILFLDVVLLFTKVKYKKPEFVIGLLPLYLYVLMATFFGAIGLKVDESYDQQWLILIASISFSLLFPFFLFIQGKHKVRNGALREKGEGINPYANGKVSKYYLWVLIGVITAALSLYFLKQPVILMSFLMFILSYYMGYPIREAIFTAYYVKNYVPKLSKEEISKLIENEKASLVLDKQKSKTQNATSSSMILMIIKPLQYLALCINFLALITFFGMYEDFMSCMIISLIYIFVKLLILTWMLRYQVGLFGKFIVNSIFVLDTIALLLFLTLPWLDQYSDDTFTPYIFLGVMLFIGVFWWSVDPTYRIYRFFERRGRYK